MSYNKLIYSVILFQLQLWKILQWSHGEKKSCVSETNQVNRE